MESGGTNEEFRRKDLGRPTFISRLQFAFTVTYHYLFPMLTMGLALLIFVLKSIYMRNGNESLQHRRAVLGQDLRHHLRDGRRHRHPAGVPVRHQLGSLLRVRRRHHRPDPGDGGRLRVLPGVRVRGAVPLRGANVSGRGCTGSPRSWSSSAPGPRATSSSPPTPGCSTPSATGCWRTATSSSTTTGRSCSTRGCSPQYAHNMGGAVVCGAFVMAGLGAFYLLARQARGVRAGSSSRSAS